MPLWLSIIALADIAFAFAHCVYVARTMRWIVARFEAEAELGRNPLLQYQALHPPAGLKALSYALSVGGLHVLFCDWVIRRGIARGRLPAGAARESVYRHFSAAELRQIRAVNLAVLLWLSVLIAIGVAFCADLLRVR
jgi:hypothetical protein